jgi:hypothetical protein
MYTLWPNKPYQFITFHTPARAKIILRVGRLCQFITFHTHVPNDEDYNLINQNTYEGEFYQEEGLTGSFVIDLSTPIAMEVDNELVDHNDDEDEVCDPKDLQMLERLGIEHEENLEPSDYLHHLDNFDSDDERTDILANSHDDPDYF